VFLPVFGEVSREAGPLSGTLSPALGAPGRFLISLALAWMGYALRSEHRAPAKQIVPKNDLHGSRDFQIAHLPYASL
jgi:hypothetical protein